jgi:hypothetical protein
MGYTEYMPTFPTPFRQNQPTHQTQEGNTMAIEDPNTETETNEIVISMDTELSNFEFDSLLTLVLERVQNNMVELSQLSKLVKSINPTDLKNQTDLALKETNYQELLDKAEALKKQAADIRSGIYADLEEEAKAGIENDPDVLKKIEGYRDSIRSGMKYAEDIDKTIKFELPPGYSKSSASSGSSGVRRIRGFDFFTDKGIKYENTGLLAKGLNTTKEAIQELFFAAQGGDDSKQWSDEVTFTVGDIAITAKRA